MSVGYERMSGTDASKDRHGEGFMERLKVRAGMEIVLADFPYWEKSRHDEAFSEDTEVLRYRLRKRSILMTDNEPSIPAMNLPVPHSEHNQSERTVYIEIKLDPQLVNQYTGEHPELGPLLLEGSIGHAELRADQGEPESAEQMLLEQIVQCDYVIPVKKIFIESKVLELLAINLHRQLSGLEPSRKQTVLRLDDKDKIVSAKELLLKHLEKPPSLLEMARMVGLNDYKLKAGFKEVFGTTLYRYLREERMRKAKMLLEQGEMNVGEVACAIGYSNPSHFAAAFKDRYGVNPSKLL
ncbi:helix-turn-helix transcriptional regulator [Paenibacillus sp. MBLB4367]|uniref:helix-turn-helix transcriptional regulator n=1 Tax=Paenibacillus sp. MBLB4367 TaxID=3384767 RepID=UPI003907F158